MEYQLEEGMLQEFEAYLIGEERSRETVKKYLRDVRRFFQEVGEGNRIEKETVVEYKNKLILLYAPSSVNSMLAAINSFLRFKGWFDCVVKTLNIQREVFRARNRELTRNEYLRLLEKAREKGNDRLALLMETLGATGIRIGELSFITVEAAKEGYAVVTLKGKTRQVLITKKLGRKLLKYAKGHGRKAGPVFVTRTGRIMDRSNILHEMKKLCEAAGVEKSKVFPHNFRHLFACVFYRVHKDLSRLADLLGHSNINTTRIYTCISSTEHARQIEGLGLVV